MFLVASGRQRAGKKSRVLVGGLEGVTLNFASWTADVTGEDLPTPNMGSFGNIITNPGFGTAGPGLGTAGTNPSQTFDEGIVGIVSCGLSCGGDWDAGFNDFDDLPGIYPRDDLNGLIFDQNRLDPGSFTFPYSRVRNCNVGTSVTGKVTFTWTGKNQGAFQVPTGSNNTNPDNG